MSRVFHSIVFAPLYLKELCNLVILASDRQTGFSMQRLCLWYFEACSKSCNRIICLHAMLTLSATNSPYDVLPNSPIASIVSLLQTGWENFVFHLR